jgi:TRAP-type C4-dicarboxylate transport system substrate-binding protein
MLASKKWIDALDPKQRDAVKQAGVEAQQHERELWMASDAKYLAEAKKNGAAFNDANIPAFRTAVKPIYTKYRSNFAELATYLPDL